LWVLGVIVVVIVAADPSRPLSHQLQLGRFGEAGLCLQLARSYLSVSQARGPQIDAMNAALDRFLTP
jgi:hypothetical protein